MKTQHFITTLILTIILFSTSYYKSFGGESVSLKKYSDIITSVAQSSSGLFNLYIIGGKLYMEIPFCKMNKDMLVAGRIVSTSNNKDNIAGKMPSQPQMIRFSSDMNNLYIVLSQKNSVCDTVDAIYPSYLRNYSYPIIGSYPILAVNPDSTAIVIDATPLVCQDKAPYSPSPQPSAIEKVLLNKRSSGKFQKDLSGIVSTKAYEKNVTIVTRMSYDNEGEPFTANMNISFLELPEKTMMPRLASKEIGVFSLPKTFYSSDSDYIKKGGFIKRWNLSENKHIVYYVDSAFPQEWKPWIKKGIEDWNPAFEAIGMHNVIQAIDYPNDPDFDPNDIKNSCVIYSLTDEANSVGPSWSDPRSGEIIQASVYFYHNVLSLLHNWRFVQTAAADTNARKAKYDMSILGPMLRYVVAHEIGHTLGLMHNMRGSYAFHTESLRNPEFTSQYGTTSSIMDYARFNYVAQPGDGVTNFLPPTLGEYDKYVIKWIYSVIPEASTPEEETPYLKAMIAEHYGDPIYEYGPQSYSSDPASQSESIGDNTILASKYGINNLKITTANIINWLGSDNDEDYAITLDIWKEIYNQFKRYMGHCLTEIGGSYRHFAKVDFIPICEYISKERQKEILNFTYNEVMDFPLWYNQKELIEASQMKNEYGTKVQTIYVSSILANVVLVRLGLTAKYAPENCVYTPEEYMNDIFEMIWRPALEKRNISLGEEMMQYSYVQILMGNLGLTTKSGSSSQFTNNIATFQSGTSDMAAHCNALNHSSLVKTQELLDSILKRKSLSKRQKVTYAYLLFEINKALKI